MNWPLSGSSLALFEARIGMQVADRRSHAVITNVLPAVGRERLVPRVVLEVDGRRVFFWPQTPAHWGALCPETWPG